MSFNSLFSLDPQHFPYKEASIHSTKERRKQLENELFFDLLLTVVAQVKTGPELYPPPSVAVVRKLYDAIEKSPADLLKKQCCLYYILRDWRQDRHSEFAARVLLPSNYCALMDSYWFLDHEMYDDAIRSLTSPTLSPNFTIKILKCFAQAQRSKLLVLYVQTIQDKQLDKLEKIQLYLDALVRINVTSALLFTRSDRPEIRQHREALFSRCITKATRTHEGAGIVANFPFDSQEEAWARALLAQHQTGGKAFAAEALKLRFTFLGETLEAAKLAQARTGSAGGALKQSCTPIEQKLLDTPALNA